jgi:predicted metal-dependent peptidase
MEYDNQSIKPGEKKIIRFNRANELIQEREKEAFKSPQSTVPEGAKSASTDKKASSIVDYSSILENLQRKKREEQKGDDPL